MFTGKIHLSGYYKDGIPSLIIVMKPEDVQPTHPPCNARMHTIVKVDGSEYTAGIRSAGKNKDMKICSNLLDEGGREVRLADILLRLGFNRKDAVRLQFKNDRLYILDKEIPNSQPQDNDAYIASLSAASHYPYSRLVPRM